MLRTAGKQTQFKANQTQNKPNFPKAKMKLNFYSTKDYENKPRLPAPPKQTQSNPILSAIAGFFVALAK